MPSLVGAALAMFSCAAIETPFGWWAAAALTLGNVQAVARVAGPNGPVCTCAGCEPDVVHGIAEIAALAEAEVAAAIKSALTKFDALDT
jgi:hypothetical protein